MNHVQIDGRDFRFADNWNELTPQQLRRIVTVLYSASRDRHHQRLRLLCVLLDVPLPYVLSVATVAQQIQLCRLTDFLLAGNDLVNQLVPVLAVPLRPGIGSYRKHWGPREYLRNLTFAEFIFADSYYHKASTSTDYTWLHKLVAVLYRPQRADYRPTAPDYGGDRREDFNEHLVAARALRMAYLDEVELLMVLSWYGGCRHYLETAYPLVFAPSNQAEASSSDWGQVLRAMSGRQFGTLSETARQPLHTVLAQMQDDGEAAEKLRQNAAQQHPH